MTAKMEVKSLKIDPSLVKPDEREVLEDLIVAALNDARRKAETAMQEKMAALTGGMHLPPGYKMLIPASREECRDQYRQLTHVIQESWVPASAGTSGMA